MALTIRGRVTSLHLQLSHGAAVRTEPASVGAALFDLGQDCWGSLVIESKNGLGWEGLLKIS